MTSRTSKKKADKIADATAAVLETAKKTGIPAAAPAVYRSKATGRIVSSAFAKRCPSKVYEDLSAPVTTTAPATAPAPVAKKAVKKAAKKVAKKTPAKKAVKKVVKKAAAKKTSKK